MKKGNNQPFNYEDVCMGLNTQGSMQVASWVIKNDIRMRRLVESVRLDNGRILDIGCGGGSFTKTLSLFYPNATLYGCDISKTAILNAKNTSEGKVTYSVIQDGKFSYPDKYFDICTCFDVLEHVPDTALFLRETYRVLKKDGILFLGVPCEGQFFSLTWFLQKIHFGDKLTYKHVGHIHPEFTHELVKKLLITHGFSVYSISYAEHFLTQCIRFFRFILPKELLEAIIGIKHAELYYDRSIIKTDMTKNKSGFIMTFRKIWLTIGLVFDWIEHFDSELWKFSHLTSWKIFVVAIKK